MYYLEPELQWGFARWHCRCYVLCYVQVGSPWIALVVINYQVCPEMVCARGLPCISSCHGNVLNLNRRCIFLLQITFSNSPPSFRFVFGNTTGYYWAFGREEGIIWLVGTWGLKLEDTRHLVSIASQQAWQWRKCTWIIGVCKMKPHIV